MVITTKKTEAIVATMMAHSVETAVEQELIISLGLSNYVKSLSEKGDSYTKDGLTCNK